MYPDLVVETFKTHFNEAPKIIVRAPGRINLIGEHTDYNGGYVLPATIENGIGFAVNELFHLGLSRIDLLKISQRAENNFVGMKCGIMDMFASMPRTRFFSRKDPIY